MEAVQKPFKGLVDDAYVGKLQLPEFQRKWVWRRSDVLRLYDSVRKDYPIGGFLVLDSGQLNLSPRPFEGSNDDNLASIKQYVLDGQQRITAGLALYYGTGNSHYFLDLDKLWTSAQDAGIDFNDTKLMQEFVATLDDSDGYVYARIQRPTPLDLINQHKMWTPSLADDNQFEDATDRYIKLWPDRENSCVGWSDLSLSSMMDPSCLLPH
jgi:hypothetical protein